MSSVSHDGKCVRGAELKDKVKLKCEGSRKGGGEIFFGGGGDLNFRR